MSMTIDRLKELIDLVAEERLAELEISEGDTSLLLVRRVDGTYVSSSMPHVHSAPSQTASFSQVEHERPSSAESKATPNSSTVLAPMAGIFYRAAGSSDKPLIEINRKVKAGTPLCIIEAMKIMNEIPSDNTGTVVKVLCDNGQAVEQGQALFIIANDGE